MKLFVWKEPYDVAYGQSMLFVVANDVDEARTLAKSGKVFNFGLDFSDDRFLEYHGRRNIELGEPDHVSDVPCAEWHEWSE